MKNELAGDEEDDRAQAGDDADDQRQAQNSGNQRNGCDGRRGLPSDSTFISACPPGASEMAMNGKSHLSYLSRFAR
jgi:hypothetical protein